MVQLFGIGLIAIVLFFAQQKIYQRLWNRNLKVDLAFESDSIFEGEKGVLKERVENRKILPLSMLKVKFQTSRNLLFDTQKGSRITDQYYRNDVFQIGGGERITRSLSFIGGKRGYYSITGADLIASDLFMTAEMMETVAFHRTLYVYPKPYNSEEFRMSLQQLNGEVLTRRHLLEDPFEYRGIREYEPFDDMRSINWKATAKTGDLKVNQRNYTELQAVRVFLNIDDCFLLKRTECAEAGIRIMAGLSAFFLDQGNRVACYTNGVDMITGIPFVAEANAGRGQMEEIYRGLARLDLEKETTTFQTLFEEKLLSGGNSVFTCVIYSDHDQDFVRLMEELLERSHDFLWIYPVLGSKEPQLPDSLKPYIRLLHI